MSALVTAFQALIPKNFTLTKNGSYWLLEEPRAGNNQFEIACGLSQAFTLDQGGLTVFPFFSDALKGMKSANDAIVIADIDGEPYVVAVEMKTSRGKTGDALKQIESGRLFVAWIRELLNFHGHWPGGACKFIGVVSLKPRKQVRKGGTKRSAQLPVPEKSRHGGYPCFVLENHPRVSIHDLVKKIIAAHGHCPAAA